MTARQRYSLLKTEKCKERRRKRKREKLSKMRQMRSQGNETVWQKRVKETGTKTRTETYTVTERLALTPSSSFSTKAKNGNPNLEIGSFGFKEGKSGSTSPFSSEIRRQYRLTEGLSRGSFPSFVYCQQMSPIKSCTRADAMTTTSRGEDPISDSGNIVKKMDILLTDVTSLTRPSNLE